MKVEQAFWLCCKKSGRNAVGMKLPFLLSLDSHSKRLCCKNVRKLGFTSP